MKETEDSGALTAYSINSSLTPAPLCEGSMKTHIPAKHRFKTDIFILLIGNEIYGDKVTCPQSLYQILTELRSMEVLLGRRVANMFL